VKWRKEERLCMGFPDDDGSWCGGVMCWMVLDEEERAVAYVPGDEEVDEIIKAHNEKEV